MSTPSLTITFSAEGAHGARRGRQALEQQFDWPGGSLRLEVEGDFLVGAQTSTGLQMWQAPQPGSVPGQPFTILAPCTRDFDLPAGVVNFLCWGPEGTLWRVQVTVSDTPRRVPPPTREQLLEQQVAELQRRVDHALAGPSGDEARH